MFIQTAYAANVTAQAAAQCLVDKVNNAVLFPLIGLLSGIAVLVFLWGAFIYVKNADNDTARQQGQNHLLYGIIGLLIMVSAYAILSIAAGTFGIGIDRVDCTDGSNPTISSLNDSTFSTSPTGFGSSVTNIDYTATVPGTDSSVNTTQSTGLETNTETCTIETKTIKTACQEPSCTTAMNACQTHYDVNGGGGLGSIIPPDPTKGETTYYYECRYDVCAW